MEILQFGFGCIPINMIASVWVDANEDKKFKRYVVNVETCGGKVFKQYYSELQRVESEKCRKMILDKIKSL